MADLTALATEIAALGESIKTLKAEGADKEKIGGAVAELLAKKKEYAEANNGIGVDGKPFGMSKADKKKAAKANNGPAKQVRMSNHVSLLDVSDPHYRSKTPTRPTR